MTVEPVPDVDDVPEALPREDVLISELKPHPKNYQHHGDDQVEHLMASIREFGFFRNIVIARDGTILAGHGAVEAATRLGMETVPARRLDLAPDSPAALKVVALDNEVGRFAIRDERVLAELLRAATTTSTGLLGTGYDGAGLAELLASVGLLHGPSGTDEVTERPAVPTSAPGITWQLGPHRLVCGDARHAEIYRDLLGEKDVELVVTDPPYNVDYTGRTSAALTMVNDAMLDQDFLDFLVAALSAATTPLVPGGPVYLFHSEASGTSVRRAFTQAGLLLKQCLVWVKNTMVLGRQDYQWQHESILYGWKPGAAHRWYGKRKNTTVIDDERVPSEMSHAELVDLVETLRADTTVLRAPKPPRSADHPTMKPPMLIAQLIARSSQLGDTVLDPFAGSGSTLIAAHETDRIARLIELDPGYCDVICRRYQNLTGTKPIRDGQPFNFLADVR